MKSIEYNKKENKVKNQNQIFKGLDNIKINKL